MSDTPQFLRNPRRPGAYLSAQRFLDLLGGVLRELGDIVAAAALLARDHRFEDVAARLSTAADIMRAPPYVVAVVADELQKPRPPLLEHVDEQRQLELRAEAEAEQKRLDALHLASLRALSLRLKERARSGELKGAADPRDRTPVNGERRSGSTRRLTSERRRG